MRHIPIEVSIPFEKPQWMADAACGGASQNTFFPGRGESIKAAQEICAGCPVREPCLEYAIANREKWGIWGGLSERQRRRIARDRRREAA